MKVRSNVAACQQHEITITLQCFDIERIRQWDLDLINDGAYSSTVEDNILAIIDLYLDDWFEKHPEVKA